MNTNMTQEEVHLAAKYIAQYEKYISLWHWMRWLLLITVVINIFLAASYFIQANNLAELNNKEQILAGSEIHPEVIDKYIDVRIELLRAEVSLNLKMILPLILAGWILGILIGGLFSEKRKRLFVKGLRVLLELNQ